VLYADKSIFLGKKFYIDRLIVHSSDEHSLIDYHIRSKGLTIDCVKYKAHEMGLSVMDLYERLFNGELIEFDLCANNAVKFEKVNRFSYATK